MPWMSAAPGVVSRQVKKSGKVLHARETLCVCVSIREVGDNGCEWQHGCMDVRMKYDIQCDVHASMAAPSLLLNEERYVLEPL